MIPANRLYRNHCEGIEIEDICKFREQETILINLGQETKKQLHDAFYCKTYEEHFGYPYYHENGSLSPRDLQEESEEELAYWNHD